VDEYVNCGDIASFERTQAFSVEAWVKLTTKGIIVSRQQWVSPFRGWYVATNSSGFLQFVLTNTWGENQLSVYQDDVLMNDNAWHHFVVTYDGSSSKLGVKFYVDGQLRTTKGNPSTLTATITNSINCQINGANGVNENFTGISDEIIIYTEELTSEKYLERWNEGNGIEWTSGYKPTGVYTSNIYDSRYPNQDWDKIFFNQELPENTTATYKVRTSSDGESWGDWSIGLANGDDITLNGRFIQWKADFTTSDNQVTPKTFDLSLIYIALKSSVVQP